MKRSDASSWTSSASWFPSRSAIAYTLPEALRVPTKIVPSSPRASERAPGTRPQTAISNPGGSFRVSRGSGPAMDSCPVADAATKSGRSTAVAALRIRVSCGVEWEIAGPLPGEPAESGGSSPGGAPARDCRPALRHVSRRRGPAGWPRRGARARSGAPGWRVRRRSPRTCRAGRSPSRSRER